MLRSPPTIIAVTAIVVGAGAGTWWALRAPSLSDCDGIEDPAEQTDCRREVLLSVAEEPDEIRAAIAQARDPETRDMLRIRLVVRDPETSEELCPQMEADQARKWCADLEGRSHLWMTGEAAGESSRAPVESSGDDVPRRGRRGRRSRGRR